jgi:N-acetylglucosamine-6-phosphate deacetylase
LRCKPLDRFMLVTDAMPGVGMAQKSFMLQGQPVRVEDGVCVTADGTLAGSDLDMASAVRNAIEMLRLSPEAALRMASAHPARFLRLDGQLGAIAPGMRASLVALDDAFTTVGSWIDGAGLAD